MSVAPECLTSFDVVLPLNVRQKLSNGSLTEGQLDEVVKSSHVLSFALKEFYETRETFEHSVVAIDERGFKARVVTKSPWCLVVLAHQVRSYLWTALLRDPRISAVLSGDHCKAVENVFRLSRPIDGHEIISSDLTSASDTLPLDLL